MFEGLLWFDDDPHRRIEEKVEQAAVRYLKKFGMAPDVCYVNDHVLDRAGLRVGDVSVLPLATVRPHHFWVGQAKTDE